MPPSRRDPSATPTLLATKLFPSCRGRIVLGAVGGMPSIRYMRATQQPAPTHTLDRDDAGVDAATAGAPIVAPNPSLIGAAFFSLAPPDLAP